MPCQPCLHRTVARGRILQLAVASAILLGSFMPSGPTLSAQPAAPLPPEIRYVPADAAVFVHVDVARVWSSSIAKSIRSAESKTFLDLSSKTNQLFGLSQDALESATIFWPRLKGPMDFQNVGIVLKFQVAYDKTKLAAGISQLLPKDVKFSLHTPSDRVAVCLIGLGEEYAKPRIAGNVGQLSAAIQEAGAGKHLIVAASTLANLPDEIRGDTLPDEVRAFQPLFRADSIVGIVDLAKDLSVEVRVKAATSPKAVEAEKALGLLSKLLVDGLMATQKEIVQDVAKEPGLKDVVAIFAAARDGLKNANFTTQGAETRARVKIPGDLPFGPAATAAIAKVRQEAARMQATNNLKQIALAMHIYHDAHGSLPPAAVVNKVGKPLLSWRVLILPYIDQDALYKEFKLDEPWDSEHNKKLLNKMPKIYTVPGSSAAKPDETYFRAFVGNGAAFDYLKGYKLQEFFDGTSNTLLVVTAASPVPWSKPDELAFDAEKDMTKLLGAVANGRILAAYADGSVRGFSRPLKAKTLNALITRGGGEVIDQDDLP